jgi:hypothetical protein
MIPPPLTGPRKVALQIEMLRAMLAARRLVKADGIEPTLRVLTRSVGAPPLLAAQAARAARRLHRLLGRGTCLEESAALAAVLARHGGQPELILGCRRHPGGEWGAHAWVVADGATHDLVPSGEHTALTRYRPVTEWRAEALLEGGNSPAGTTEE